MIGVLAKPSEVRAVHEFFQLFKTPWEFVVPRHSYEFVITTTDEIPRDLRTQALAVYGSRPTQFDEQRTTGPVETDELLLEWSGGDFPLYGEVQAFQKSDGSLLTLKGQAKAAGFRTEGAQGQIFRLGYDLFQEIEFLLSKGQPAKHARIPTLEIHIALLRNCMVSAGVPFVEVPPVPAGYDFMACLTHDVDFIGIRQHKFDQTMWGFLYRSLAGSLLHGLKGRISWHKVAQNWKAAFSLPLVHLGLLPDFWIEFERYAQMEEAFGSTFFFIPYKGRAGESVAGPAPKRRAAKYDLPEHKEDLRWLASQGCEIGLHGIDAWNNSQKARDERNRIVEVGEQPATGVRMHWLYFGENSPKVLEEAGFSYDSTFGYNDAVGFRAGTAQAFSPLVAERLLELPLVIQDTAMFYPDRMNISEDEALDACQRLMETASNFGGTLTVNWHTRSLSSERLWDQFYARLLGQLRSRQVWSATGLRIVEWFQSRRALCFDGVDFYDGGLHVRLTGATSTAQPPMQLRVFRPHTSVPVEITIPSALPASLETSWKDETSLEIASARNHNA